VYSKKLAGGGVLCMRDAVIRQFFNVLVLIVQSFMKIACYTRDGADGEEAVVRSRRFVRWCCASCLELSRGRSSRRGAVKAGRVFRLQSRQKEQAPHGRTCGVCFGFSGA